MKNTAETVIPHPPIVVTWREKEGTATELYERVHLVEEGRSPDGYIMVYTTTLNDGKAIVDSAECVPVRIIATGEVRPKAAFSRDILDLIKATWGNFAAEDTPTSKAKGKTQRLQLA